MKTLKIILIVILLLGTVSVYALFNSSKGEAAMTSMSLPIDAKSLSLGSANSVCMDDASAIFNNPAAVDLKQKISILANTNLWYKGTFHQYIGYTQKFEGIGVLGAGINYFSYGTMEYTPFGYDGSNLKAESTFGAYDMAIKFLYANRYNEKIKYGATFSYMSESIGSDLSTSEGGSWIGLSVDAGITYNEIIENLNLGATLKNIGFMSSGDKLDYTLRVGGEYLLLPKKNLSVLADIKIPVLATPSIHIGCNYTINKMFEVRAGYRTDQIDISPAAGLSLGFGLNIMECKLDIAYQINPIKGLGATGPGSIWITAGYRIGTPPEKTALDNIKQIEEIQMSQPSSVADIDEKKTLSEPVNKSDKTENALNKEPISEPGIIEEHENKEMKSEPEEQKQDKDSSSKEEKEIQKMIKEMEKESKNIDDKKILEMDDYVQKQLLEVKQSWRTVERDMVE